MCFLVYEVIDINICEVWGRGKGWIMPSKGVSRNVTTSQQRSSELAFAMKPNSLCRGW